MFVTILVTTDPEPPGPGQGALISGHWLCVLMSGPGSRGEGTLSYDQGQAANTGSVNMVRRSNTRNKLDTYDE